MEKVGLIRLPDHEWAIDMRHSIEFPDDDGIHNGPSIMSSVPWGVRNENLPNHEDAHMEVPSDEEEENDLYAALSAEAARHAEVERRKAAIFIQKMWRGHCLRGVHIRLREASRQMSAVRAPPSNARFTSDAEYYTQMYGRPYPPHVKKAIYIQKMWRGWIGRRDANREWWAQQTN